MTEKAIEIPYSDYFKARQQDNWCDASRYVETHITESDLSRFLGVMRFTTRGGKYYAIYAVSGEEK